MKEANEIKSPRVLVVVKSIDGGTGTFLQDFLKIQGMFPGDNFSIKILCLEHPKYRVVSFKNTLFLRSYNSYPQRYSLSLANLLKFGQELLWIKKELNLSNSNIIMGVDFRCNLLAVFSRFLSYKSLRVVTTSHVDLASLTLNISKWPVKNILKVVVRSIYSRADITVGVSKGISGSLRGLFGLKGKITTIYNGIEYHKSSPRTLPKQRKIRIISVGRLSGQKDFFTLIKAIGYLNKTFNNFELLIVGDGQQKKELVGLTKSLKLTTKIIFLGWKDNIKKVLKSADIFVLSTNAEGFSYVLIEAMSLGLPVISTDVPYGPSEILDNGKYGFLVPPKSPEAIANILLKLVKNKSLYEDFSKKAAKRSQFFSTRKMYGCYRSLFLGII